MQSAKIFHKIAFHATLDFIYLEKHANQHALMECMGMIPFTNAKNAILHARPALIKINVLLAFQDSNTIHIITFAILYVY